MKNKNIESLDTKDTRKKKLDENSLTLAVDIAKEEYLNYFQRNQMLDVKIGLLMAFYGIIYPDILDVEYLKNIWLDITINKNLTISNLIYFHLNIANILFVILALFLLIKALTSKDTRFVPLALFDKKIGRFSKKTLMCKLLDETYKETMEKNNDVIDNKHNSFNISCYILLVNVFILTALALMK